MLSPIPTTTEAITAAFDALPQEDPSLNLTKHYKGITLSEDVRIVDIQPDCATIRASRREIFPCLEGEIHLHSQEFPKSFSGRIHPIDYARGTFLLSDLAYADWKGRNFERVHPKDCIYVNLHHVRGTYRAFLEDISIKGMGILGKIAIDPTNQLEAGLAVMMEFQLTKEDLLDNLAGILVYRQKICPELVKYGLHILPNTHQKRTLKGYISQRRKDILEEINQTYIRSCEPHRIENLYF
jgi:hypothetical protein